MDGLQRSRVGGRLLRPLNTLHGHLSTRLKASEVIPPFLTRPFQKPQWLQGLVQHIDPDMRGLARQWGIEHLIVFAKNYEKTFINWASISAMIELWHPDTHTFMFSSFEASILLEEAEHLLGLRKLQQGEEPAMVPMEASAVALNRLLGSPAEFRSIVTSGGISLARLAIWTSQGFRTKQDTARYMKGLCICLAGVFLFPSGSDILGLHHLESIWGIWNGRCITPAVLGYLYEGLSSAAVGGPFHGSFLLLQLWMDVHLFYDFPERPGSGHQFYQTSPIYPIRAVVAFEDEMVHQFPGRQSRDGWRTILHSLTPLHFLARPIGVSAYSYRRRSSSSLDLHLVTPTDLVAYRPHRCLAQLGLPRTEVPLVIHGAPIISRESGDTIPLEQILNSWHVCIAQKPGRHVEEPADYYKHYIEQYRKIRPRKLV